MTERYINAAKDGFLDILREASRRDLNTPDDDGMTATHWAAHNGNLEALRLIVGREGDVDKSDYLGQTALHHAAARGHMGVVSYLVNWGCNVYALDNDLHSALDIAALHNRNEIIRFLDNDLAQRQSKNPRHVAKQKEEAMKTAERNVKRYEKLLDAAAKRHDKDQKKRQKEMEQKLTHVSNGNIENGTSTKSKTSFFKTLTMRGKKPPKPEEQRPSSLTLTGKPSPRKYSDFTGMTTSRKGGIASKIQKRQMESVFKVSDMDATGQRTLRAVAPSQGYVGYTPEVMYVGSVHGDLDAGKRRPISADFFNKSSLYKSRSESDLLDSGVDSYNGDDDFDNTHEDNTPGIFNRPAFGNLAFLQKNAFLGTLQSFDDNRDQEGIPENSADNNGKRLSGETVDSDQRSLFSDRSRDSSEISKTSHRFLAEADQNANLQALPWDQEDLDNLDDDDDEDNFNGDETSKELSAVNMFLWSCGLPQYLHIFSQEKIDMPILMGMTDGEMKELGIPLGHRKKFRDAVSKRQAVLDAPPKIMKDSYL